MTPPPGSQTVDAQGLAPEKGKRPISLVWLLMAAFILIGAGVVAFIIICNANSKAIPQSVSGKLGDTLSLNGCIITVHQFEKAKAFGKFINYRDGQIFVAVEISIQSDKNN